MRIVYMGTPDFAVPALLALHEAGHEIAAVVSQPDKPRGRHGAAQPTPVKVRAQELSIPVLQPEKASDPAFMEEIRRLAPDVIVVAAYGKILKQALLDIPKYGCINVHASLLPRWRGAAPIQQAVIAGDRTAGVTTMMMDAGLDTGDMLLRREIPLSKDETGGSLFEKLSALGGELITETLSRLAEGTLPRTPQPEEGVCYAGMLTKEMGNIDWSLPAEEIERLIRGLSPWPGAYTYLSGKLLKIHRAGEIVRGNAEPGAVLSEDGRLFAGCGDGLLELCELQLEGRKRMGVQDFLRGAERLLSEHPVLARTASGEQSEKKA